MPQRPVKMSRDEVSAFIDREFPQIYYDGRLYHIEEVTSDGDSDLVCHATGTYSIPQNR